MNGMEKILNNLSNMAEELSGNDPQDYIGQDGLLYCHKCRSPKQCRVPWLNSEDRVVYTMCKCEQAEEDKRRAALKKCEENRLIDELKKNSLMDEKFSLCKFDNIEINDDNRRQVNVCKRYAWKFDECLAKNQGLLFYGDNGTGKTTLACCIANWLIDNKKVSVLATSIIKILQAEKKFATNDEEKAYLDKLHQVKLLIIDDLGAERDTDYALEIVYNVIDSRYRSGKPMIITTNLTFDEMNNASDRRHYRIYERILETCYPVGFKGKSFRKKNASMRFDEMKKMLEQ